MNFTTQYLASPLAPSSQYLAFLKGYPQSASDGGSVIKDYSAALNQAAIDPYLSYANAMSEVGWITCLSVAHPAGFSVSHAAISTWDMSSGKSLILAFQFKTSAIPSVRTNFVGTSGGGQNGIGLDIDTNGRLGCLITDGTHSYNSGHGSGIELISPICSFIYIPCLYRRYCWQIVVVPDGRQRDFAFDDGCRKRVEEVHLTCNGSPIPRLSPETSPLADVERHACRLRNAHHQSDNV